MPKTRKKQYRKKVRFFIDFFTKIASKRESKNRSKLVKMGEGHWPEALLVAQITLTIDFGRSKVDFNRFRSDLGAILEPLWTHFAAKSTKIHRDWPGGMRGAIK